MQLDEARGGSDENDGNGAALASPDDPEVTEERPTTFLEGPGTNSSEARREPLELGPY